MGRDGFSPGIFANRVFRRLWLGSQVSNFGTLVQIVGASWAMTVLSGSESMVALVQTASTLPIMLFSLFAGVLADNFDRRTIILIAQALMFAVSLSLALLGLSGGLTPWLLLSCTFLIGCGTALHNPSWQATVGDIVPRADVPAAIAMNAMGFNVVRGLGPAAGGLIVATLGAAAAFALNAASYLALIWALLRWHPEKPPPALPREDFGAAILAGVRYVSMSPNVTRVILRTSVFGFAAISTQALLPLVVRDNLGAGPLAYGVLLGVFGVGAVVGGLASRWMRARFSNERIALLCFVSFAAMTALLACSTWLLPSALAMFVSGSSWLVAMSLSNATVQMSTPRWVVGRALALYQTGAFGSMAVGSWAWGQIAAAVSVPAALLAAAAVLVVGAALGRAMPFPDFEGLDLAPLNRFRAPETRLDLQPRSGPMVVDVDYEIAERDVPEFLELMVRRRRIRLRDGARQWRLMRNLEHPSTWTERYLVPTWVEYLRHHARRTMADGDVNTSLARLHSGISPPEIRRMIERPTR